MLVALSGTPGTGKTSVSNLLKNQGYAVIDLNQIAIDYGFVIGIDSKRDTKIIDINGLDIYIKENCKKNGIIFIDGHSSHLLTAVDYAIILRCHPKILKQRLKIKGWKPEKIKENVDAETLDIILSETYDLHNKNKIFEINTTEKSIESVFNSILEIVKKNFKSIKKYKIGKIDWSEEILNDF